MSAQDLRRLARVGAAARLKEIRQEMTGILAAFPDLRGSGERAAPRKARRRPSKPKTAAPSKGVAKVAKAARRTRRKMSAAARKAVSDRMTKYWAARRKSTGGRK